MSVAAPTIGPVRAAWGALDELPVAARRVGTALVELLDWKTWCSVEPTLCDDPRRGITRRRIAERANLGVRQVTRGLAQLRLSGLVEVTRRRWLQSWYRLDALALVAWATDARAARRIARVNAILLGDEPAPTGAAPAPPKPGAEALARASAAQPRTPDWAQSSKRPGDLHPLVWVFATTLHGEDLAREKLGAYAARMETLCRRYKVGEELPVDTFAGLLVTVATWLRHDGRILSKREQRKNHPIHEQVRPHDALRPGTWAIVVDVAKAWFRDENPRDMAAVADALIAELGAPTTEGQAHSLLATARGRDALSAREESTLLHELLRRVPAEPDDELPDDEPPPQEDVAGELDPAWLAKLALAVPEVEALASELAALPAMSWDDPIFRRPTIDPERKQASAQKQLRAQMSSEADAWLVRARPFLAAPDEGSPAVLHDLAEALSRLRGLSGRLAR